MRMKVLISAPYLLPALDRFRAEFDQRGIDVIEAEVEERLEADDLMGLVTDIDGAICGDDRFTAEVLQAAPRLKVISKWGTGVDSIDAETCERLNIRLLRTPNAFSEPVADTVYGFMLAFARQVPWSDRAIKNGNWEKLPSRCLAECTLGIVGVGDCGKAVARRAGVFSMTLLGNDIEEVPARFIEQTGIEMIALDDLLARADFVTLHTDLNPTSFHLIGRETLEAMKSTAVLINASRGPIVDETALIEALESESIAGAALDVFEDEPLPSSSPLCRMDNVLLSAHNANSSPRAWENVHRSTIDNLFSALSEEHPEES